MCVCVCVCVCVYVYLSLAVLVVVVVVVDDDDVLFCLFTVVRHKTVCLFSRLEQWRRLMEKMFSGQ